MVSKFAQTWRAVEIDTQNSPLVGIWWEADDSLPDFLRYQHSLALMDEERS